VSTESRTRPLVVPTSVPPVAWPAVGAVAAAVAVVHLVLASFDGRWFDEVLMLAIGRHHLDLGSVDQPPLVPLLARLADTVAPDVQVVMRLPAVLAAAGAVVLAALIARELGGDRRAQILTALAQATGTWAALSGHWLTPYSVEAVQWLAIGWLLVRWERVRDDRLLVWLGVVVGVAAETKFQVLLLAAVLLVSVAVLGPRDLLRRPSLWLGAGLASVLAAPTLVWQAVNGWPQLAMGPVVAGEAEFLYGGRAGVAVELVVFAGVLGVGLGAVGLWRLLAAPDLRRLRYLGTTTVVLAAVFALAPGRPYYLAGLYGLLAAVGAVGLQRRREAGRTRWRWVAWPATVLGVAVAAGALAASMLMASPTVPERVAAGTATAWHALPGPVRARTVVVGESYVYAAYVDDYSQRFDLPPAASPNRSYGWFPPPAEDRDTVLWVGRDPALLRPFFADVRPVGVIGSEGLRGIGGEDTGTEVWLLGGRQEPWSVLWPRLRQLTVS
jgi:4-amino-4-deoxy-L-arabinose transferase-like glycosyltransferase